MKAKSDFISYSFNKEIFPTIEFRELGNSPAISCESLTKNGNEFSLTLITFVGLKFKDGQTCVVVQKHSITIKSRTGKIFDFGSTEGESILGEILFSTVKKKASMLNQAKANVPVKITLEMCNKIATDFLIKWVQVTYKPTQPTHDQHTTPKCYLKNFSNGESFIYHKVKRNHTNDEDLQKEFNRPLPLSKATVVRDFYTVKSGIEPMLVEKLIYMKEIEDYYTKIYNRLIDTNVEYLEEEEHLRLLMFLLSLHCRTPKQFELFFSTIPEENHFEMDKIKEDYKAYHLLEILPRVINAHGNKRIAIATITDSSEFITSDNPVLFVDKEENIKNHVFDEQFNESNGIIIPIDPKHCCILSNAPIDKKNLGFEFSRKRISRIDIDIKTVQRINHLMVFSADKYFFGSENYIKGFFTLWKLKK
ncbi:MAG TPA: DUF4238 domain-containing protein [Bacteroidia bacterium]|nr:DUF4238 domain-containing protein [Bacteroidia bacterium]